MSPCEKLIYLARPSWSGAASSADADEAERGIEAGQVLFLPELPFGCEPQETVLFTPAILGSAKNASFDPATGRLGGTSASGADAELLRLLIRRFSDSASALVEALLPKYRGLIA